MKFRLGLFDRPYVVAPPSAVPMVDELEADEARGSPRARPPVARPARERRGPAARARAPPASRSSARSPTAPASCSATTPICCTSRRCSRCASSGNAFGFPLTDEIVPADELAGRPTILDALAQRAWPASTSGHARGCGIRDGTDAEIAAAVGRRPAIGRRDRGPRRAVRADRRRDDRRVPRPARPRASSAASRSCSRRSSPPGRRSSWSSSAAGRSRSSGPPSTAPRVLLAWVPGDAGPDAIADVLARRRTIPAASCPISFPRHVGQVPLSYRHHPTGGRSNWKGDYVDGPADAALAVRVRAVATRAFEVSNLRLDRTQIATDGRRGRRSASTSRIAAIARATRSSSCTCRDEEATVARPVLELRGFRRVDAGAGRATDGHLPRRRGAVRLHRAWTDRRIIEPGRISLFVGTSSADLPLRATFELVGPTVESAARDALLHRDHGRLSVIPARDGRPLGVSAVIDPTSAIGEVDRRLFGSFVEHMGRAVYGGIYEPGHPTRRRRRLASRRPRAGPRARRDRRSLSGRQLRLRLRLGGRRRPARGTADAGSTAPGDRSRPNPVGTDEFIAWARLGRRRADAGRQSRDPRRGRRRRDLVEYCNSPAGTPVADRRAANGHAAAARRPLWCLGNEMDGPWQIGHKTAVDYGRLAAEAGKAMRAGRSVDRVGRLRQFRLEDADVRGLGGDGPRHRVGRRRRHLGPLLLRPGRVRRRRRLPRCSRRPRPDDPDGRRHGRRGRGGAGAARSGSTSASTSGTSGTCAEHRGRATTRATRSGARRPSRKTSTTWPTPLVVGCLLDHAPAACRPSADRLPRPARQRHPADPDARRRAGLATDDLLPVRRCRRFAPGDRAARSSPTGRPTRSPARATSPAIETDRGPRRRSRRPDDLRGQPP